VQAAQSVPGARRAPLLGTGLAGLGGLSLRHAR
jgi:hypothetical protein